MEVINKYQKQLEAELEKPSVQRKLLKITTVASKNEKNKLIDLETQENNHSMKIRSKRNSTNTAKANYIVFVLAILALICVVFVGNTPIYGHFNFFH